MKQLHVGDIFQATAPARTIKILEITDEEITINVNGKQITHQNIVCHWMLKRLLKDGATHNQTTTQND